jgi:hypothetical protein
LSKSVSEKRWGNWFLKRGDRGVGEGERRRVGNGNHRRRCGDDTVVHILHHHDSWWHWCLPLKRVRTIVGELIPLHRLVGRQEFRGEVVGACKRGQVIFRVEQHRMILHVFMLLL